MASDTKEFSSSTGPIQDIAHAFDQNPFKSVGWMRHTMSDLDPDRIYVLNWHRRLAHQARLTPNARLNLIAILRRLRSQF